MRALKIASGIAVLLTTLMFGHLIHHYYQNGSAVDVHDFSFLAGLAAGVLVAVFSFIGGCLLIRSAR